MLTLQECAEFLEEFPAWSPQFITERRGGEILSRVHGLSSPEGKFFNLRTVALWMRNRATLGPARKPRRE
jgi:hypothetical protein